MTDCDVRGKRGNNRRLVLDLLKKAKKPMGAYELLESLRGRGLNAPPQIYRALEQLIEERLVHKIESLNVFTYCARSETDGHGPAVFSICTNCGAIDQAIDLMIDKAVARIARGQGFKAHSATIELSGLCGNCANG